LFGRTLAETEFRLQRVDDLALVTIDNGEDWTKPTMFGRHAFESLERVIDEVESQSWSGLVLTGKPFVFAAGADLDMFPNVSAEEAREGSRAGHELFLRLRNLPFPTLAAINGACLGGGVEIALHCNYRTIASSVGHFACPEVFLGIFPAWGGTQLIPRLVGVENAVKFVVTNPLRQNKMLDARAAHELGFADAVLDPVEFVDESIAWLRASPPKRKHPDLADTADVVARAHVAVDDQTHGAARAPHVALDLIASAAVRSLEEGYRAEEDAIADLMPQPQAQNSIYAFNLVERRAKRGVGIPDVPPRAIKKVGVVGAGLMATQIATLILRRLEVPIVLRDVSEEIVERARATIGEELSAQVAKGRYSDGKARFLVKIVTGGTGWEGFDDCDLVVEAAVEQLDVKQEIFAELRKRAPDAVLATNTSSLSVEELGAHVGLHFFNPVALMPLVEIVRHDETSDEALATAWDVVKKLRKRGVVVGDAPGFVVNRVLTRMSRSLMDAIEHGTPSEVADEAILRLGLPMAPSVLVQMVGPRVANHVLETMHDAFPDRFPLSPGLAALAEGREPEPLADEPRTWEQVQAEALEAMADEIAHLLDEGVVAEAADVDTCMLLGAGFPFFLGGITPYLQQHGHLPTASKIQ
jgi:3-hydroxyacyl-CoA dehydrogenase/enoyl-CoA hydratase/carnithine racemase